jgi:hypothetical protein
MSLLLFLLYLLLLPMLLLPMLLLWFLAAVLSWVLGGNNGHLERARPSSCRLQDRLKVGAAIPVG